MAISRPTAKRFNHSLASIVKTISDKLSQRSSFCCQRQQSPLQNTEVPFTNKTFELSLVRPNVVYNLLRMLKSGLSCQVHIFYIRHSQYGQLTAVKTEQPLTSIPRPYRGLMCQLIEVT